MLPSHTHMMCDKVYWEREVPALTFLAAILFRVLAADPILHRMLSTILYYSYLAFAFTCASGLSLPLINNSRSWKKKQTREKEKGPCTSSGYTHRRDMDSALDGGSILLLEVARSIVGLPEISPVSAQHLVWRDLVNLSVHSITSVPATLNSLADWRKTWRQHARH